MSDDGQLGFVRCGLEMEHEAHPHPGGQCDGQVDTAPALEAGDPLAKAFLLSAAPRPWTWSSLTTGQAEELRELLDRFVTYYNDTFAIADPELIPACWPLHPALAHELAALYSVWVHAFQSGLAPADQAMSFYDRWLPGFQARLASRLLGTNSMRCTPGNHRADWNPAAKKQGQSTKTGIDPDQFDGQVADALGAYVANPAHLEKP